LAAARSLGCIGLFVYVVSARIGYPYPLEWLEPDTPDTVARILRGSPIYTAPSYEFVASMKTPLYYYVVALLSPLLGTGLVAEVRLGPPVAIPMPPPTPGHARFRPRSERVYPVLR
jgi:hypothetical protein